MGAGQKRQLLLCAGWGRGVSPPRRAGLAPLHRVLLVRGHSAIYCGLAAWRGCIIEVVLRGRVLCCVGCDPGAGRQHGACQRMSHAGWRGPGPALYGGLWA